MKYFAFTLIFLTLAGSAFAGEVSGSTLELDYSDHEPLGNMRTTFLNDVFFPAIERETQGRVKIKTHWNAEISTGYNAIKAINQESADLAVVVPEYCMKDLHLHQLFKSFPVGPTGQE
ncbi:MAG: hypothetical protein IJU48_07180 [Synergistaceae bacterium]|nr:hypothetical protein [Synergistaceae bacterium]